jgi:hypothetical protein
MGQNSVTTGEIISSFIGVYARVARKLNVHSSFVSRVANGIRSSPLIDEALKEELKALQKKMADWKP